MKILYSTTIGGTMCFFQSFVREMLDNGHTVEIATNETSSKARDCYRQWGCRIHHLSWSRSPFSLGNIKAISELRKVVKGGDYDIVHCHTPIAAACTRLACRQLRKNGLKVIYTAHGFHFYKGAPLKNWLIYYPVEKLCAHWTDVLITINKEDYELAKKKLKVKRIEYVPGVGIDVDKFKNAVVDRDEKKREIGLPSDSRILLSVGELNENKNHQVVIRALGKIRDERIHYLIAGIGNKADDLMSLANELNVNLHLLGHRNDVAGLYKLADFYILPSLREGLNVSLLEALTSGTTVLCSRIRGNVDLVNSENGYLFDPADVDSVVEQIRKALYSKGITAESRNKSIDSYQYSHECINKIMLGLYSETIHG